MVTSIDSYFSVCDDWILTLEFTVEKYTYSRLLNSPVRCLSPSDVGPMTLKSLGQHDFRMQPPKNAAHREAFVSSLGLATSFYPVCPDFLLASERSVCIRWLACSRTDWPSNIWLLWNQRQNEVSLFTWEAGNISNVSQFYNSQL